MTTCWKLQYKKKITKEMINAVKGKGANKKRRIKAAIIDIMSQGDTLTTEEVHDALQGYMIHQIPVESSVGTLLRSLTQVEALGRIRVPSKEEGRTTKPIQTWSLKSIEIPKTSKDLEPCVGCGIEEVYWPLEEGHCFDCRS